MTAPRSFGAWVRTLRLALRFTQRHLAQQVSCSPEMIRKIEAGTRRPSRQMAERLAQFLQVDVPEQPAFVSAAVYGVAAASAFAADAATPQRCQEPPARYLLGRATLMQNVFELLAQPATRLVTLAGPAGVGKTALALHVAERLRSEDHHVTVISLVALSDPEQVLPMIRHALHSKESTPGTPLTQLIGQIGEQRLVLVLDNLEQLIAVAPQLSALLAGCPALTVVTTSRVLLRVPGELVVQVPPLAAPRLCEPVTPDTLTQWPATALFVARACEARPDLVLSDRDAVAIVAICRQMDCLPLAIELVAARCTVLAPTALQERLAGAHGYALLELPRRPLPTTPPHHQSLRDALAWSYDLLSPLQRRLLNWLSVFRGGATIEAVEQVCASQARFPAEVLDGLQVLVDASLIVRQAAGAGEPRFTLLGTIQEYAQAQLASADELTAAQGAQARYYRELVCGLAPLLEGPREKEALGRLAPDTENLRAARAWLLAHDLVAAAELEALLWIIWHRHMRWREGLKWLSSLRERCAQQNIALPTRIALRLLNGAATLHTALAQYAQAQALYHEAIALARSSDEYDQLTLLLTGRASLALMLAQPAQAPLYLNEAERLAGEHGLTHQLVDIQLLRASLAAAEGQYAQAQKHIAQSSATAEQLGDHYRQASVLIHRADLALLQQDPAQAKLLYLTVLRSDADCTPLTMLASVGLGRASSLEGAHRAGLSYYQRALLVASAQGAYMTIALCLEGCAGALGALGSLEAACLYGRAAKLRDQIQAPMLGGYQLLYNASVARAAAPHSAPLWATAWEKGGRLALDAAIATVLAWTPVPD